MRAADGHRTEARQGSKPLITAKKNGRSLPLHKSLFCLCFRRVFWLTPNLFIWSHAPRISLLPLINWCGIELLQLVRGGLSFVVGAQDVPGSFFPRRVAVVLEVDTTPTHTRPRTSSWAHTHTPLLTTRPQLSCHCSSPSPNATTQCQTKTKTTEAIPCQTKTKRPKQHENQNNRLNSMPNDTNTNTNI